MLIMKVDENDGYIVMKVIKLKFERWVVKWREMDGNMRYKWERKVDGGGCWLSMCPVATSHVMAFAIVLTLQLSISVKFTTLNTHSDTFRPQSPISRDPHTTSPHTLWPDKLQMICVYIFWTKSDNQSRFFVLCVLCVLYWSNLQNKKTVKALTLKPAEVKHKFYLTVCQIFLN